MLLLSRMDERYLPMVQKYASDPCIGATSTVPFPYPKDGALSWYGTVINRQKDGSAAVFAVTEDREFRGVISINAIQREAGRAQLDYWIARPYQGRGIATQAAALAVDHAKTELKLQMLSSRCLTTNLASARVLERNGFAEYGRLIAQQGKFTGQELRGFRRRLVT
ncbi:MAG: GNAT family N-acetyltransferase [Dyella sp.]